MILGITGTREGATHQQIDAFKKLILYTYLVTEFHHGDCVGVDAEGHDFARGLFDIIIHPPENPKYRAFCQGACEIRPEKEYKARNCDIVDECDLLIGMPKEEFEIVRSGTWHALRYARKMKKPCIIIWPSGKIAEINLDKLEKIV